MVKWEYLKKDSQLFIQDLNKLGADGWELITVMRGPVYIFKRPIEEKNKEPAKSLWDHLNPRRA